jgi:hypothetical protein
VEPIQSLQDFLDLAFLGDIGYKTSKFFGMIYDEVKVANNKDTNVDLA